MSYVETIKVHMCFGDVHVCECYVEIIRALKGLGILEFYWKFR